MSTDSRSNKVLKKTRDRKRARSLDVDKVLDEIEFKTPDDLNHAENKEKKSAGIIIDGKTYTCATCKTGHRVGVCKHARERPMTATHPPGRPPAGAPKKVICDCPKQCNCKKKDCKCARDCNCMQMMYMLVYVPAPDEDIDAVDEEKGTWKLGKQVLTDLKGNILTPEQVKERQEQKEARKGQVSDSKSSKAPSLNSIDLPVDESASPDEKSEATGTGGCCKHKENVSTRNIVAEASPQSGKVSKSSADGCNCGHTCDCAFCPQHPNNSTSMSMARQQAVHFANHSFINDQPIVPFIPTMPQNISCMGGLPRFAISRYPSRPSYYDLQRTFPNPGYVIGYPIWSTRTDGAGFPVAPFPTQGHFVTDMNMIDNVGLNEMNQQVQTHFGEPFLQATSSLEFSQDEFGIGNAFVASAGSGDWNQDLVSSNAWPMDNPLTAPIVGAFSEAPDYAAHSMDLLSTPVATYPNQNSTTFSTTFDPQVQEHRNLFDLSTSSTAVSDTSFIRPDHTMSTRRSCCEGATPSADPM